MDRKSTGTINDRGAMSVSEGDVGITYYGAGWAQDTNTGLPIYGVEKDDGSKLTTIRNYTIILDVAGD